MMTADVATLLSILGEARPTSGSLLDAARRVESGLPLSALERLADVVAPDEGRFLSTIVPKATLSRRRAAAGSTLSAEESNKVARLAKVWAMALQVWGEEADAREFLRRPHPLLDGRAPREVALASDPGADAVINVIGRGAYGGGV
jgi:putative toxin-antitoxin system antitoxin component (TIGR02293 family)